MPQSKNITHPCISSTDPSGEHHEPSPIRSAHHRRDHSFTAVSGRERMPWIRLYRTYAVHSEILGPFPPSWKTGNKCRTAGGSRRTTSHEKHFPTPCTHYTYTGTIRICRDHRFGGFFAGRFSTDPPRCMSFTKHRLTGRHPCRHGRLQTVQTVGHPIPHRIRNGQSIRCTDVCG